MTNDEEVGTANGIAITIEILWGDVIGVAPTEKDRVRFTLDKMPGRVFTCSATTIRRVQS